jgi:hypothetical protein
MFEKSTRISMGQGVRSIAIHYYIGLTGIKESEAENSFDDAIKSHNPIVVSALRMAEYEVFH